MEAQAYSNSGEWSVNCTTVLEGIVSLLSNGKCIFKVSNLILKPCTTKLPFDGTKLDM